MRVKNKIILLFIIFVSLCLSLLYLTKLKQIDSNNISREQKVSINNKEINIIIADEEKEWSNGLSNFKQLNDAQGMLFVFPDKQIRTFWMKNMLFPLDIIWINSDTIAKIDKNLPPAGETPQTIYLSEIPVNYVLEINAGLSDKYNFRIGDKILFL